MSMDLMQLWPSSSSKNTHPQLFEVGETDLRNVEQDAGSGVVAYIEPCWYLARSFRHRFSRGW